MLSMKPVHNPPSGRTLPNVLLTLAIFVVIAFVMVIVEKSLETYLPESLRGMALYLIGGTLSFLLALRMSRRPRPGETQHYEREEDPQEPGAESVSGDADALDGIRRRIRDRKGMHSGGRGSDKEG